VFLFVARIKERVNVSLARLAGTSE
jgi:hypothetical protein